MAWQGQNLYLIRPLEQNEGNTQANLSLSRGILTDESGVPFGSPVLQVPFRIRRTLDSTDILCRWLSLLTSDGVESSQDAYSGRGLSGAMLLPRCQGLTGVWASLFGSPVLQGLFRIRGPSLRCKLVGDATY